MPSSCQCSDISQLNSVSMPYSSSRGNSPRAATERHAIFEDELQVLVIVEESRYVQTHLAVVESISAADFQGRHFFRCERFAKEESSVGYGARVGAAVLPTRGNQSIKQIVIREFDVNTQLLR